MKRISIALIFSLIIAVSSASAQQMIMKQPGDKKPMAANIKSELETYFDNLSKDDKFSGAVLVAKDGEPIFKKAYGLANRNTKAENNTETKFNLASMNKMFTSVAVAQLAERGKLSFEDTIGKHLPDYPNKAVADKVTIHQLLTHTSGMGIYQNEKFFAQIDQIKTIADLLPFYVNEPLAFEPGTKWEYSNSGYAVLGLIIEKVSGQNYFDYVRENIFKPAGMKNTDSYEKTANVPNLAVGYMKMGANNQPDPNAPITDNSAFRPMKGSSAGGGYSTVGDLLKFSEALQKHKLLSKKFTDIITTGKFDVGGPLGKYAYGFGDKIFGGKHIIGHNGGNPGIAANLDIFPELGYTAIILSNFDPQRAMMQAVMKIREIIPAGQNQQTQSQVSNPTPDSVPTKKIISGAEQQTVADAQTKEQLKIIMAHLLEDIYVNPEKGREIAARLRAKFESDAYKNAATPQQLAEMLTLDLREIGKDKHLYVRFDASAVSESDAILTTEEWGKQKQSMSPRRMVRPQPNNRQPDSPQPNIQPRMNPRMMEQLKANNYDFRQAKYLDGNIGYIQMSGFAPGAEARAVADKTMALLAGSDAMIIDLRQCPGGSGEMVEYLASYFFDKEPRLLMSRYFRPTDETIESKTVADIPGKRMVDTDLYFLVSSKTGSACESLPYILQQFGRAKVVGEQTAGAGYNNALTPLGKGYIFSISVGRPIHPVSGKGWEGVGVQPDIAVNPELALEAAQREALQKLINKTSDKKRKKELTIILQSVGSISTAINAATSSKLSQAEQEVRKLEREWLDALENGDAETVNRIVADDFKITFGDGRTQTKADILAQVKAQKDSGRPSPKLSTEDEESRVEGDMVILTGRFIQTMERDGQMITMEMRYIDAYAKRNGRWQAISSQLTRIRPQ